MSNEDTLTGPTMIENLNCNICRKEFIDAEEINYHETIYHDFSNCKFCNNSYKNSDDRNEHEINEHYPLQCYCCNEYITDYKILNDHILKLHECKICDFCTEKVYPKELYLDHLSRDHKIKSTIQYSSGKQTYLILDPEDEIRFQCKLCNETLPIIFFYAHYKEEHSIKIFILLNIIQKMGIKEYVKSEIDCLGTKITNMVNNYNDMESLLKSSNLCNICCHAYNINTPKEFHNVYCSGIFNCNECDSTFNSFEEKQSHAEAKHFIYCPLGCEEFNLDNKSLNNHCNEIHGIVTCKYCGIFMSGNERWVDNHLRICHNYKISINNYSDNKIFIVNEEKISCALCGENLTNLMTDLEKVVLHYLSLHKFCLKNLGNLLIKNPLIQELSETKKQKDIEENNISILNHQIKTEYFSDDSIENPQNIIENSLPDTYDTISIKQELIYNEIDIEENETKNIDATSIEITSNLDVDEYDMNGYNDINFSEIQCIFSDTSDDAMSDTEISLKSKSKFKKIKSENETKSFEDNIVNNSYLFKPLILKCEVCLTDFEKKDKYAKHLERLHGFKCNIESLPLTVDQKRSDQLNIQNFDKSSKFIAVVQKYKTRLYLCLICKAENNSKSSARKHIRTHDFWISENCDSFELGYKCRFCSNLFWTIENRNEHQISNHLSLHETIKFMKCYECTTVFSSKTCLKRHVQIEHNGQHDFTNISYKCMRCHKLYPNLTEIRQHFGEDHPDSKSLYCSLSKCRTKCSTKQVLKNHYRRLHQQKRTTHACEICERVFKSSRSKKLHIKLKHIDDIRPRFKCRVCDELFESSIKRKEHTETIHPGIATFFCQFCDKGFRSKSGLNSHRQTHKDPTFDCPQCHKSFTRRDSYVEHMLIHNGPRLKCDQCEREFVQRSNLIRHKRIHTGIKPYFCRYCYRTFADKSACNSHERVHTREEVSACPYCNKVFSKKQKLKYHIKRHTGEGLLSCDVCQKTFTSPYSLKKHKETHQRQGIPPYLCTCGKRFSNNNDLQKHDCVIQKTTKEKFSEAILLKDNDEVKKNSDSNNS